MKKKVIILVAILGVMLLLFSMVYAKAPRHQGMKMAEGLNLSDEQQNSIKDIRYNFQKVAIGLQADLKTSRLELQHQMAQDKPDQQQISILVDKIGETQKQLLKQNIDRKLAVKAILTPEQLKKFFQMKEGRMEGRMECRREGRMRGRMNGRMGGRMEGRMERGSDFPGDHSPRPGSCTSQDDTGI
jgi:Spy/CpxP family protein refolding chaperone